MMNQALKDLELAVARIKQQDLPPDKIEELTWAWQAIEYGLAAKQAEFDEWTAKVAAKRQLHDQVEQSLGVLRRIWIVR